MGSIQDDENFFKSRMSDRNSLSDLDLEFGDGNVKQRQPKKQTTTTTKKDSG
jgi:hypothetical protein